MKIYFLKNIERNVCSFIFNLTLIKEKQLHNKKYILFSKNKVNGNLYKIK